MMVPFPRNAGFVGRASLLEKLEAALFDKKQPSKISLFGLGGVGKTQVALELAYRTQANYPQCSIIWIPTNNVERQRQAYIEAAKQLGIAVADDKTDVRPLVQRHLNQDSAGRWLVIYDNADDLDMWTRSPGSEGSWGGLLDYVPRSNQGCVVFTTRNRKIAQRLSPQGLREEVTQMDDDTARQLLFCRLDKEVPERDEEGEALIKELCHLPLAIAQAAAYIYANKCSFEEYLALLNEQEEDVVKLLSEEFGDEGSYHTVKDPVATTWLISFTQIRRSDPVAAEYLSLLSCFDSKDIPQSLLPPGKSRKERVDAIGTLTAYAFVSRQPKTECLDMHRLVHLAIRNWLKQEEKTFNLWMHKAVTRLHDVLPLVEYENRNVWRLYLPHARYVLPFCRTAEAGNRGTSLVFKFGLCTISDGRYGEAESCFLHTTETYETKLGAEHLITLTSMTNLACTFCCQGRFKEAERLNLQVMEMSQTKFGVDHCSTLSSMANLASTYSSQGRWKEAEKLQMEVMEMRQTKHGVDHSSTLNSMADLESTLADQGRWQEAERLTVQMTEISKTKLGADHPFTLTHMADLAFAQCRWEEAERLFTQLVEISKRKLGVNHPNTLNSISNLALVYGRQGRWEEVERLLLPVVEASKIVQGVDHPKTLIYRDDLALAYARQGRLEEAVRLNVQVMEIRKMKFGDDHPYTLASLGNLALCYSDLGRHKEAVDLMHYCSSRGQRIFGLSGLLRKPTKIVLEQRAQGSS